MDHHDSAPSSGSPPDSADDAAAAKASPGAHAASDPTPPEAGTLPSAVPIRARHDGWTPLRQHDFIAALAATGCVAAAAKSVGLSRRSAYRLRVRADANIFRQAWDIALDFAIRNLSEAALSRAIHGVSHPIFYQGQQVGERRRYDERLTQFLLRYRDPVNYGVWRDNYEARRHPDGAGIVLANALNVLMEHAFNLSVPSRHHPGRGSDANDGGDDGGDDGPGDGGDRRGDDGGNDADATRDRDNAARLHPAPDRHADPDAPEDNELEPLLADGPCMPPAAA